MTRYLKLALKGRLGASEVWSVNPTLDPYNEIPAAWDQAKGDAAALAIAGLTIPSRLLLALSNAGSLTSVRLELRDTSTPGILGVSEYSLPTPKIGTGAPVSTPQTSIVASLRTATPLSQGRGRIYWPSPGVGVSDSTFKLAPAFAQDLADGFSSYLTSICRAVATAFGAAPIGGIGLSVYSPTKNTLTPVNRILVGDVLDTQRRRRDAVPETYKIAVFPASA